MKRITAATIAVAWVVGLVVLDLSILTREDHLRLVVDRALAERFGTRVRYESFEFEATWDGPLTAKLTQIVVAHPDRAGEPLVEVGGLEARFSLDRLLSQRNPVPEVELHDVKLHLRWDADGKLETPSPFVSREPAPDGPVVGPPSTDEAAAEGVAIRPPAVRLDGLELVLHDPPGGLANGGSWSFQRFVVDLEPGGESADRWAFRVEGTDPVLGRIEGQGQFAGGEASGSWEYRAELLAPGLRERLGPTLLEALDGVDASGGVRAQVEHGRAGRWEADVFLEGVALRKAPWDFPVTGLSGRARLAHDRPLEVDLVGRLADAAFTLSGGAELDRFEETATARLTLPRLVVDDDLLDRLDPRVHPALPPKLEVVRGELDRFEARGPVRLTADVTADPSRELGVRLLTRFEPQGMSFRYMGDMRPDGTRENAFPFRVEGVHGLLYIDDEAILLERVEVLGQPFELRAFGVANVKDSVNESYGVVIEARNVPIREDLLAALKQPLQGIVRGLNAEGTCDARITVSRMVTEKLAQPALVTVSFEGLTLKPDAFPAAISNVSGVVRGGAGEVVFTDMQGQSGGARVTFDGTLGTRDDDVHVALKARAQRVPIDSDLIEQLGVSFPDVARGLVEAGAAGVIDELAIAIDRPREGGRLTVSGDIAASRVAIVPPSLPIAFQNTNLRLGIEPVGAHHELVFREGSWARFGEVDLAIGGKIRSDGELSVEARAEDAVIGAPFLEAVSRFVPELAAEDPAERPVLQARGGVRIGVQQAAGIQRVEAGFDLRDLSFMSRADSTVWLSDARARLDYEGDRLEVSGLLGALRLGSGEEAARLPLRVARIGLPTGDGPVQLALRDVRLGPGRVTASDLAAAGLFEDPGAFEGLLTVDLPQLDWPRGDRWPALSGGEVRIRDLSVGSSGEEEAVPFAARRIEIDALRAQAEHQSTWQLEGVLSGHGLATRKVRLPMLEADLVFGPSGLALRDVQAALFEISPDEPTLAELRERALAIWPRDSVMLAALDAESLRRRLADHAREVIEGLELSELRRKIVADGLLGPRRAWRGTREELVRAWSERGGRRTAGRIVPPSELLVDLDEDRFSARVMLEPVSAGRLLAAAAGGETDIEGRIRAQVEVEGSLEDPLGLTGKGALAATVRNLFEVPVFLQVVQSLDLLGALDSSPWVRIRSSFRIGGRRLEVPLLEVEGRGLRLAAAEPATITFDGAVEALLDVRAIQSTPVLGPLLELLPRGIVRQVTLSGTLDEPAVSVGDDREDREGGTP